jgi:hypothetical protein
MAIFGGVVVTDDKMSYIWSKIVFMNTSQLGDFGGNAGLDNRHDRLVNRTHDEDGTGLNGN